MKKVKELLGVERGFLGLFLVNYGLIIYLEFGFRYLVGGKILEKASLYILLFNISFGMLMTVLGKAVGRVFNRVVTFLLWVLLIVGFTAEFIYFKIYGTFFSISGIMYSVQVAEFWKFIWEVVKDNWGSILVILVVPIVGLIGLLVRFRFEKGRFLDSYKFLCYSFLFSTLALCSLRLDEDTFKLYFEDNNFLFNIDSLGVVESLKLDVGKILIGFEEKLDLGTEVLDKEVLELGEDVFEEEIIYEDNIVDIDFEGLIQTEDDEEVKELHNYFKNSSATKKNVYTGYFEDKNLILIVAEAFYPLAIDEELTPTLYKLANEGFKFENFYQPIYGCSTSDGEFVTLYSLLPGASTCTMKKTSSNYYPYSLGNITKEYGYKSYAFHGGSYYYYDRNKTLPNLGFDYYACGHGLNINCSYWPQSDVEVSNDSMRYYINEDKFIAYYMSISGHLQYNFYGNMMASKNEEYVKGMNASEAIKAYMATQIELDRAVFALITKLEEVGKLDDTVIAIVPDHYPYGLSLDDIRAYDSRFSDDFELYKNSFLLWNSAMEESITVSKYASNLDVLPTLLNLWGIDYDSRLFMGKDIFSSASGLVIFNNRSWISDKGRYDYKNSLFVSSGEEVDEEYISMINQVVSNKFTISKLVVNKDYYKLLNR